LTATSPVAALVLAAGASRRLGTPKQLLATDAGDTLLARTVRTAAAAGCDPIVVVVGANADVIMPELDDLIAALRAESHAAMDTESDAPLDTAAGNGVNERTVERPVSIDVVYNGNWSQGMSSSVVAGLEPLEHTGCSGAVLLVCDQPAVTAEHLRALIALHREQGGRAVSSYARVRGIPAVWPRHDWPALLALTGDRGARVLLRGNEPAVPLPDGARDLDTPDDVERWRADH
jgi:molybdenum cofactor cytidylyltransferase